MTDDFPRGTECRCQQCNTFLGHSPGALMWTGVVKHCPQSPDGLEYKYCRHCKLFNRFEITPQQSEEAA